MPASPKRLVSSLEGLYNLRAFYPKNIILSYINVNSIRNKLDDLKFLLGKSLDIICISETKLDETFPTAQFAIEGFSKPYRLDITSNSGGLLFYVKANLPSKLIRFYSFPNEIQCIPIELNISLKSMLYYHYIDHRIKISISQQTFVGLEDVLKPSSRHVLKTSSTRLQRNNFTSSKTS